MNELTIKMGDIQHRVLCKHATANNTTPEQYATNIIVGWLNSKIKGVFIDKMKAKDYDELETMLGKVDE